MSESLTDLLATEAELDLIACRDVDCSRDLVLAELALFAAAIDEAPLPPVIRSGCGTAMTGARKGGWALAVTVALMVTSSGVAAAVSEDPMAPLHFVTNQVWKIGPQNGGKMPGWDINGSMPVSTVPAGQVPGVSAPVGGSGPTLGGTGQTGAGTGSFGGTGSTSGGGGGSGIGSGYGRSPVSGSGSDPGSGPGSGSGSGGNSGTGGRDPSNVGHAPGTESGNPRGPGAPQSPGEPIDPGYQNQYAARPHHPSYGEVPGTGTGGGQSTHHCRVDHPSIPGQSTWGDAPALHPCRSHSSGPSQPTSHPPTPRQPKLAPPAPPAPPATGTQPISTGSSPAPTVTTPAQKPESLQTRGSLR